MLDQTSKLSSVVAESLRCNSVVSGIANSVDSWIGTDGTESTVGTEIGWIWEDDDELVETWKLLIYVSSSRDLFLWEPDFEFVFSSVALLSILSETKSSAILYALGVGSHDHFLSTQESSNRILRNHSQL